MGGFEGGRRPCYLHDLRKVLPDSSDAAMTAGELADANHWYSDAVDDKLGELFSQINRGIVSGIRLRMRGSKEVRYWLEEVTDGGKPIKKAEPKTPLESIPAIKKTRRVFKVTRVQELLEALPRKEAEAATIGELCDKLKTSEKKVHNYMTKLRRAMERGPYAGVHGEVMTVLENLHGGNPKAGTGPSITIGRYWFKEDGVVEISAEPPYCTPFEREMPERPPEPEPQTKFDPDPEIEMQDQEVAQALEGETEPDVCEVSSSGSTIQSRGSEPPEVYQASAPLIPTMLGPYDPNSTRQVCRQVCDDFDQPFDNIGLPEQEKVLVLRLTEMEATILMDMIGVAMDTIPDLEAWRKVAAKVSGSTGGQV